MSEIIKHIYIAHCKQRYNLSELYAHPKFYLSNFQPDKKWNKLQSFIRVQSKIKMKL